MRKLTLVIAYLALAIAFVGRARAQTIVSTFAGNAQHTASYSTAAQHLNAIHWSTTLDLNNSGAFAHYGAPLITPANTIFVPVKTASNGFEINVFNAANGAALYTLSTDYILPSYDWIPAYQPALAVYSVNTRLYYPGAGGTIYYIDNPDSTSHAAPVQQVFYTTLANYQANASAFNSSVFINTPITSDSSGNVFFGFRVQGTAPTPLNTTESGFARIDPNGNATYVLAGAAANDSNIGRDSHNSAPALSNDQTTIYVVVKGASTDLYGYLLGLDSTTLATKYSVFLKDPRAGNTNNAQILDDSTASPMVGPDGDVYFGIMGNPFNGSRGFMLHFNATLTTEKTPGGFGWDNTAAIVPASMVPSYNGSSSYLLFTKYNNYADGGSDSGDGVNRIALLDPNATEVDAHASSNGMLVMREVLTVIGPTADASLRSSTFPYAVREWCINTAAVNPATDSVFAPSEDGRTYRWNLATNSLSEWVQLGAGIGEPYVPTVIGPDGTVFTLNGGHLWALGSVNGVGVAVTSSTPDVRTVVTGQPLTFTASVTDTGSSGTTPTGTVTFTDTTYAVVSGSFQTTKTTLASDVPLDSTGRATYSSSTLTADFHFITVQYSGDSNFSAGSSSLVQTIHAGASSTRVASTPNPSSKDQSVTFTATIAAVPPATGTPTGQVTFQQSNTVLAQVPLSSSGTASFSTSGLAVGSNTITATYASDFVFAASSGSTVQTVQQSAFATTTAVSSSANPSVFSQSVTFTAAVTSSGGVPTGTVTFKDGSSTLGTSSLDGTGHVTFTTSTLTVASHSITATYNGSSGFAASTSSALTQVVNQDGTTSAVTSSHNPSKRNQKVTFTAAVTANSPGTAIPGGSVTFKDGTTTLSTQALNSSGKATFSTSSLSRGSHSITAVYGGSSSFLGSTSPVLTQTVQ
jgi:hypothetical protein